MKASAFLAAAEALPFADLVALTGGGGIVVVAPHPDDESLGCGGLIAEACARDTAVRLIVVSDGVGSHPNSRLYPPEKLKALRETETIAAAAALGLDRTFIRFLGLPDASVPTEGPLAEDAREAIVKAVASCDASVICVTWRHDPHCDHEATAKLVDTACAGLGRVKVAAYPIWGWTLPPDAEVGPAPRGLRLDITRHLAAKHAAIQAHASQATDLIHDDPQGFRLDATMIARFARPYEIFLETVCEPTS